MLLEFRHEVLLAARLELGLTQEETAQSLQIDVRTYRRYEAGAVNDPAKGFSVRRAGRRQLLARIGEELGIATEDLVKPRESAIASSESPTRWSPHHAHVLQPAQHFVGREPALDALQEWIDSRTPRPRIHAIVAVGGAGKSALTGQLLERLPGDPSHGVLVWSFYEDGRAEGFLAVALRTLGLCEPPSAPLETLERLVEIVRGDVPHLLVLDGFEVMQSDGRSRPRGSIEDPHLRRLLCTIAAQPGGTRVLVTSRYPLVDLSAWEGQGLRTQQLEPLPADAQLQLLLRWGVRGTPEQARLALERFGGHALSVATLASYVVGFHHGALDAMDSIDLGEAAEDDLLAFRLARLLEAYAAAMSEAQRDLVARVSAFPRGAEIDALLALAQRGGTLAGHIPTDRRGLMRALSRLEAMGVVYRSRATASIYAVHPFVADHFRDRLGATAMDLHGAEQQRLLTRLKERPTAAPRETQLDLLEDLLVHTLLAGHGDAAYSLYLRTLGGFNHLGLERGDMVRGLRILRAFFIDGDPERPRRGVETQRTASLLYDLALYASAMGDPELALLGLRSYVEHSRDAPSANTTGWRTTAYVLRLQGKIDEALHALDRAMELGAQLPEHVVRNLALRGAILHDRGDLDDAADQFARANALDPNPRYRRALWEAELLIDQGQRAHAQTLVRSNREACLARGWGGHISHCDVVLGHCAAHNDPEHAGTRLHEARHWANASGEVEAQLRCYELDVRLQRGAPTQVETLERAHALVSASGFHRFTRRFERARG